MPEVTPSPSTESSPSVESPSSAASATSTVSSSSMASSPSTAFPAPMTSSPRSSTYIGRRLAYLPSELQDQIFSYLEKRDIHVFLFDRGTHASAMDALWHHVDLGSAQDEHRFQKLSACLQICAQHFDHTRKFSFYVSPKAKEVSLFCATDIARRQPRSLVVHTRALSLLWLG